MIVSDKTYTDLSNLSEDQREIVIKAYQDWLDESGLKEGPIFDDDFLVSDGYKYALIHTGFTDSKVFVGSLNYLGDKQEVTYEEIIQHNSDSLLNEIANTFGLQRLETSPATSEDSRIEYWHKTCDLVTEYAGTSEVLKGFYEGLSGGDSYLKIVEEGLQLRHEKVEKDRQYAEMIQNQIVQDILNDWKDAFSLIDHQIIYNNTTKLFEITSKETGHGYQTDSEYAIEKIYKSLESVYEYKQS